MTNRALSILASLTLVAGAATLAGCGDDPAGRACEPSAGTICTLIGTGEAGYGGDEGPAWKAAIYLPMDVTLGPDGRIYFPDWNNHRIRAVDGDEIITTVAGTGVLGDGPNGPALEADFNHPTNVAFDAAGDMFIAAWHNSRIKILDMDTGMIDDVCGTGGRAYGGDGGPAIEAVLDLPAGLAFDVDGTLLVVDQANQVVRQIEDGIITRRAGQCIIGECEAGATPVRCEGSDKYTCSTDPEACTMPCEAGFEGDGGPAIEARFSMPVGQAADPAGRLAVAADGTIYVADTRNHRIRVIDPEGTIGTLAGTGEAGYSGDGGPAVAAALNNPVDIAIGPEGTVYFTDTFNSCVRAVAPDGVITTVVGQCGMRGDEGDGGSPTEALLDRPYGVEVDADGNLYIADTHNHRVRVVLR